MIIPADRSYYGGYTAYFKLRDVVLKNQIFMNSVNEFKSKICMNKSIGIEYNWRTAIIGLVIVVSLASCSTSKRSDYSTLTGKSDTHIVKKRNLSRTREQLVKEAVKWIGTPYEFGGMEKGKGSDCSGLVMAVYEQIANIKIPRNSAKQADFCIPINQNEVSPGDLVFFATGKDITRISHVGIMIDDVQFVHSSQSKGVVISRTDSPYYVKTFKGYGRVPGLD